MVSQAAERGREVRQRLVAAAAELVPERGWSAVSTRVLAERAGVSTSVVHYHFASVQAVLGEALLDLVRRVLAELGTVLGGVRDPAEAVEVMLTSLDHHSGQASLLGIEGYLAATRDEELRERIGGAVEEFRLRFGRWLGEHGVPAAGETAAVLVAVLDGLLLHRGLGADPDPARLAVVLRRLVGGEAGE